MYHFAHCQPGVAGCGVTSEMKCCILSLVRVIFYPHGSSPESSPCLLTAEVLSLFKVEYSVSLYLISRKKLSHTAHPGGLCPAVWPRGEHLRTVFGIINVRCFSLPFLVELVTCYLLHCGPVNINAHFRLTGALTVEAPTGKIFIRSRTLGDIWKFFTLYIVRCLSNTLPWF